MHMAFLLTNKQTTGFLHFRGLQKRAACRSSADGLEKNHLFTSEPQWELSPFKRTGIVSSYEATTSKRGEFAFIAFPLVHSKFPCSFVFS